MHVKGITCVCLRATETGKVQEKQFLLSWVSGSQHPWPHEAVKSIRKHCEGKHKQDLVAIAAPALYQIYKGPRIIYQGKM